MQNCTCFNLRKATRAVTQLFDEALKPCGLYATQFTLLAAISSQENVTITELSKTLVMDRTTLTRNLNPLQKSGWVEVTPGDVSIERGRSLAVLARFDGEVPANVILVFDPLSGPSKLVANRRRDNRFCRPGDTLAELRDLPNLAHPVADRSAQPSRR